MIEWLKKHFDFQTARIDNGIHFGVDVFLHRHGMTVPHGLFGMNPDNFKCPVHFHLLVMFLWWFVELTIGKQDPDEEEEEI